ncbi:hypothetical protein GQ54DRAFT_93997 [Martensiomyces pterosporus]|nr:hypothetical protein GQ54DRAFT_93997 [Martensiomyces pterosporus]
MSFFSFLDTTGRKQQEASVQTIDDFLSSHVQAAETPHPPNGTIPPAAEELHRQADLDNGSDKAGNRLAPKRPPLAALEDQIHPLMRNRRLETPDDIAAWIAERKSKYPTDANIHRKNEEASVDGKRKHSMTDPHIAKKDRKGSRVDSNPLSMLAGYGTELSDDNSEAGSRAESPADSGSDSDSDSDAPEIVSAKHQPAPAPFKPSGIAPGADRRKLCVCKFFVKGNCRKGNACPFAHPESVMERVSREENTADSKAASGGNLLEMLLAKDIERENHRVFQCIEYICNNDFLGVPLQYSLMFQK